MDMLRTPLLIENAIFEQKGSSKTWLDFMKGKEGAVCLQKACFYRS